MGRIFQKISPVFSPLDAFFSSLASKAPDDFPVICILACPRSGSTLTYQIVHTGIESIYLSNIFNLLYTTPYIGARVAKYFTQNHNSSFTSTYGFVPGMAGEAEGLRFWSYWTGQLLDQSLSKWNAERAPKLKRRLARILRPGQTFVTGYLGHVFCIKELRKLYPKILFVHLQRNLVDNAYSIFQASPDSWFSTKPIIEKCSDSYTRIARQLLAIHYSIFINRDDDYIEVNFETLKSKPAKIIDAILEKANIQGADVRRSSKCNVLEQLAFQSSNGDNREKLKLRQALLLELGTYEDVLFVKLMEGLI